MVDGSGEGVWGVELAHQSVVGRNVCRSQVLSYVETYDIPI